MKRPRHPILLVASGLTLLGGIAATVIALLTRGLRETACRDADTTQLHIALIGLLPAGLAVFAANGARRYVSIALIAVTAVVYAIWASRTTPPSTDRDRRSAARYGIAVASSAG